eukprot:4077890-Prymnesium_polylepis.2
MGNGPAVAERADAGTCGRVTQLLQTLSHEDSEQPNCTCSGFRVAGVSLGAADGQTSRGQHFCECACLNRIAKCRSSTVRLSTCDVCGLEPPIGERGAQQRLLCQTIRSGETRSSAILADAASLCEHGRNTSVFLHGCTASFTAGVTVRSTVKCMTAAKYRGHTGDGKAGAQHGS